MTREVVEQITTHRFEVCKAMLSRKNKEYAGEDDSLHNFRVVAAARRISEADALWGMFMKHFTSIQDMVDESINFPPTALAMEEKITDAINYLVLLECIWREQMSEPNQ